MAKKNAKALFDMKMTGEDSAEIFIYDEYRKFIGIIALKYIVG